MDRLMTTLADRRWPLLALFGGVLGPLYIFSALAEDVWDREGFAWDLPLLHAIHGYATPSRDAVMIVITWLGSVWGMIPLCALAVVVLLARRRQRDALFVALAYGGALALNGLAKPVFHNTRPTLWVSPAPEDGYGFPSGHAMGSMALVAALVTLAWPTRWRWPAGIVGGLVVAAIGLSRLYLGVHYPSDVVAAWTASLAWVVGLRLVLAARVPGPWRRQVVLAHAAVPLLDPVVASAGSSSARRAHAAEMVQDRADGGRAHERTGVPPSPSQCPWPDHAVRQP